MDQTRDQVHDTGSHVLWAGCGDMLRRSRAALDDLVKTGARLTFTDIKPLDDLSAELPRPSNFFNIEQSAGRQDLRACLRDDPISHMYIANWPPIHLLTAFKYCDNCPSGTIIISKPLDTNFDLIEVVGRGGFPSITDKIFVHDHYLNKTVVGKLHAALPKLLTTYGDLKEFELYLIEFSSVEDEGRQEALRKGVIFDLQSHLLALVQYLFLAKPYVACYPGMGIASVTLKVNQVARARYILCDLPDGVETFAAVDISVVVNYRAGRTHPHEVRGLLVVGKGIKPTHSVEADLKGMRFKFELAPRTGNFSTGDISPPLRDIEIASESGFYRPILHGLSRPSRTWSHSNDPNYNRLLSFTEARQNADYLRQVIVRGSSNLCYYERQKTTVREVLASCVSEGSLNERWLPRGEFADIGYSPSSRPPRAAAARRKDAKKESRVKDDGSPAATAG